MDFIHKWRITYLNRELNNVLYMFALTIVSRGHHCVSYFNILHTG